MSSEKQGGTATADDDELFADAVGEMTADIESHLSNARQELPDADAIWSVDAPNILGALNTLRGELNLDDATAELREARKLYVMADRADAFDNDDDALAAELDSVADTIEQLTAVHDQVGDLTSDLPELKQALETTHEGTDAGDTDNAPSDKSDSTDQEETLSEDDVEADESTDTSDDTTNDVGSDTDADDAADSTDTVVEEPLDDEDSTDDSADDAEDADETPVHTPPAND